MAEEAIYKFINRMSIKYPGLPYSFQDPYTAGRSDVLYVLWEDKLSISLKEKLAMELMEHILICIEKNNATKELAQILYKKPIFLYLEALSKRIDLYLAEELVDEKQLYSFGIKLATQSKLTEQVKLGMIILGFFENDFVRQILKTLGFHSAFTLYALEASKNFVRQNQFVYELAQNTCGYGKLVSLYILEPVRANQRKWMFEQGAINQIAPNLSAIMCIEKPDMAAFYRSLSLTEETFYNLSYLLAYASEDINIKEFSQSLMMVEKYIKVADKYAKSFIDLAAIVMIKKSMVPHWEQQDMDIKKENGWSSNKENLIRNACDDIIKQPKWENVVLCELSMPKEHTSLIISVLEILEIVPHFKEFAPLLQRDLFDMDILKYVLIEYPEYYLTDIFDYLQHVLPEEVLREDPQEILEDNITPENKPDIWLVYLLKAMRRGKFNKEGFFIRCLTCRFPDVRIEAIQALRVFKLQWSENVLPALEHAYRIEPVKNIRKRLLRLMGRKNYGQKKEQRYVDVSEIKVTPSPFDICLISTNIAGTFFRDLMVVEGQLEVGDILYLMREPENKYDEKAILVTTEDGYVLGYVPRTDNTMLSSMMDAGEKLYGVLASDNLDKGKPDIQIMLSKTPKQKGKVIRFPY